MEKQRTGKMQEKRKAVSAVNQEKIEQKDFFYSGHAESDKHCYRSDYLFKTANVCSLSADRIDFSESQITVMLLDR